jgi:anti-sigma B factor antagonist
MPQEIRQHLRVKLADGVAIVGFLDTYLQSQDVVQEVSEQLFGLLKTHAYEKMLLQCEGVRFMSSEMIAVLVSLHDRVAQFKGRLRLCGLTPTLRDVFKVSRLDRRLEIFETEKDALAKF